MSRPKPNRSAPPLSRPTPAKTPPETVDPVWILKAVGFTIIAALICGYITLCLLFYQGQWQLVLHPQLSSAPLANIAGLSTQPIRFGAAESGLPQLSGVLISAKHNTRYSSYTILYLRSGEGSLAQNATDAQTLALLESLGLNVFAFDYRGFGQSDPIHPNETRMTQDAETALAWLRTTQKIPEDQVILYGSGVGAGLAAALSTAHPNIPAIILDSYGPTPLSIALSDPRTRALPVRALFHEYFSLSTINHLVTPKLLVSAPTSQSAIPAEFLSASAPKTNLELVPGNRAPLGPSISRFLDQYLGKTLPAVPPPAKLQ